MDRERAALALMYLRDAQRLLVGALFPDENKGPPRLKLVRLFEFVLRQWDEDDRHGRKRRTRRALWAQWNEANPHDRYEMESGFHKAYRKAKERILERTGVDALGAPASLAEARACLSRAVLLLSEEHDDS